MTKFINTPAILTASVLMFAAGLIVGQQTTSREVKTRYIVDASEVEVIYNNPYKALTLDECVTDWECETAQLMSARYEQTEIARYEQTEIARYEQTEIARYTDNGAIAHEGCTVDSNEG